MKLGEPNPFDPAPQPKDFIQDFHFVRQNSDGSWTHKPGVTEVRNTDYKGNVIEDPAKANWGMYTLCNEGKPLCWPCPATKQRDAGKSDK